jgi:mRNA interferase RelE/StbE
MTWLLWYTTRAERTLSSFSRETIIRIRDALDDLAADKDPFRHIKRLKGLHAAPLYSFRMGEYRAILAIEQDRLIILVIDVGHRKTSYWNY